MAGKLFDRGLPALNVARVAHDLLPPASFWDQVLGAERILVLSSLHFRAISAEIEAADVVGEVTGPLSGVV